MKARGSAIIIAMLLITAVGSIAFGISRVLFVESTSATAYVNGAIAYYAAESGLEEGFLRYRYNQNAEVPFTNWDLNTAHNYVYRNNLQDSSMVSSSDTYSPTAVIADPKKQYYDLRMGYLGTSGQPFHAQDADDDGTLTLNDYWQTNYGTGDFSPLSIPKDESVKIDLANLDLITAVNKLEFDARFTNPSGADISQSTDDNCYALIEIKFVVKDSSGFVHEYKNMLTGGSTDQCSRVLNISKSNLLAPNGTNIFYNSGMLSYNILDLRDVFARAGTTAPVNATSLVLYVKPLYYNAVIGIHIAGCDSSPSTCVSTRNKIVPGPYSSIKTTGYYGGTTRKLEANIDRQSGTLYDLFDYVIYRDS